MPASGRTEQRAARCILLGLQLRRQRKKPFRGHSPKSQSVQLVGRLNFYPPLNCCPHKLSAPTGRTSPRRAAHSPSRSGACSRRPRQHARRPLVHRPRRAGPARPHRRGPRARGRPHRDHRRRPLRREAAQRLVRERDGRAVLGPAVDCGEGHSSRLSRLCPGQGREVSARLSSCHIVKRKNRLKRP